MPLLYDQRYLEMLYLILAMSQVSFATAVNLILQLPEVDDLGSRRMKPKNCALKSRPSWIRRATKSVWETGRRQCLADVVTELLN